MQSTLRVIGSARKKGVGLIRAAGVLALVVAGIGLFAPIARAEGEVDALIRKGVELRRQGKEQEALDSFQRAAQIRRTPRVVAQIALAEQAMGVWVAAERDLKEALAGAAQDPWVAKNRRQLSDALQVIQNHLGSLEVLGQPAGADVLVDGEIVGKLPISSPIRLPLGEVTVTVRKTGYEKVTRVVAIPRGELVLENVSLGVAPVMARSPVELNLAADPPRDGAAAAPAMLRLKPMAPPPGTQPESPPVYKRWWFWTAIGVVALGASAGAYLLLRDPCPKGAACSDWN